MFRRLNWRLLAAGGIHTSVFPSGHVSSAFGAAFGLLYALPGRRAFGLATAAVACGIAVSTVYGRYHYAVDAVAGLAASLAAGRRLHPVVQAARGAGAIRSRPLPAAKQRFGSPCRQARSTQAPRTVYHERMRFLRFAPVPSRDLRPRRSEAESGFHHGGRPRPRVDFGLRRRGHRDAQHRQAGRRRHEVQQRLLHAAMHADARDAAHRTVPPSATAGPITGTCPAGAPAAISTPRATSPSPGNSRRPATSRRSPASGRSTTFACSPTSCAPHGFDAWSMLDRRRRRQPRQRRALLEPLRLHRQGRKQNLRRRVRTRLVQRLSGRFRPPQQVEADADLLPDGADPRAAGAYPARAVRRDEAGKSTGPMVRYTDYLVGKLVKAFDDAGIRGNTIVIFTTDNGTAGGISGRMNGRTIRGGKAKLTENGPAPAVHRQRPRPGSGGRGDRRPDRFFRPAADALRARGRAAARRRDAGRQIARKRDPGQRRRRPARVDSGNGLRRRGAGRKGSARRQELRAAGHSRQALQDSRPRRRRDGALRSVPRPGRGKTT